MNFPLLLFGARDTTEIDAAIATGIFLVGLVVAALFHKLLVPLILRIAHWTPTDLDNRIILSLKFPITLAILLLGAYLAFSLPVDLSDGQQRAVDAVVGALGILLGVVAVASLVSNTFNWYIETGATRERFNLDQRLIPIFRRISSVLIYGLGALLVLSQLGVNISPLIAGLGLGGLAVALAIQPTLTNLFAGTYVMSEGVIAPGDYIEMENSVAGYVLDVGWRSTRIRTWTNNLVVVPNSRFAETIITNYQRPMEAVNVIVNCGISYDSDLYHVEQVCHEVMDDVRESSPHAVRDYGGWFGYDSFGDSNVNFWLFMQAKDRLASFGLQTALMQRLHQRFNEEGIVINYPVRTLQFPPESGPEKVVKKIRRQGEVRVSRDIGKDVAVEGGEGEGGPGPE